ncbi:hypothetical protein [Dactylosporangium sp. CA-233914]|uniref:hypothetical protein n=1 Tax=Dactylosporangium sp. CA-233914 TaxID=3239934 RepID=UPI003D8B8D2B
MTVLGTLANGRMAAVSIHDGRIAADTVLRGAPLDKALTASTVDDPLGALVAKAGTDTGVAGGPATGLQNVAPQMYADTKVMHFQGATGMGILKPPSGCGRSAAR